ncbi:hypothetical protein C2845_PM16G02210 [Panicum miliaceum]|uniref:Uncharacterized protein n=1 Tax=Panicum miliaceum TaxID=4540 RepID=A0A3L6PXG2_PANMI|nr:hypothetical protein C2845_PM16G02210 [Panicum miliaceum]
MVAMLLLVVLREALDQPALGEVMPVKPCKKSTYEDKERCKKAIDDSKQVKKARLTEQQELRDAMDLVGAPEADDEITMVEVEEIDGAGGKTIRKIGPMDKFTMPLDQASLSNTKACGVEECGNLRRSARLPQMRDVDDDDFHSEAEEEQINEDEIDFESDQENVVPIVGDEDEGENDD